MALETKILQKQYPRCHFARQSTHRPFFTPLENSARVMGAITKQRERALALLRDRAHEPRRVLQGCEEGSVRRLPREMAARVLFL